MRLLVAIVLVAGLTACSQPESSLKAKSGGAPAAAVEKPLPPEPILAPKPDPTPTELYLERVRNEVGRVSRSTGGESLPAFNSWAQLVDESTTYELNSDEMQWVLALRGRLASLQARELPRLRREWITEKKRGLRDVEARGFGPRDNQVELFGFNFATSSNIVAFQESISESLHQLRFNQALYRWSQRRDEHVTYTLNVPRDQEVVVWNRITYRPAGDRNAQWR